MSRLTEVHRLYAEFYAAWPQATVREAAEALDIPYETFRRYWHPRIANTHRPGLAPPREVPLGWAEWQAQRKPRKTIDTGDTGGIVEGGGGE